MTPDFLRRRWTVNTNGERMAPTISTQQQGDAIARLELDGVPITHDIAAAHQLAWHLVGLHNAWLDTRCTACGGDCPNECECPEANPQ